MKLSRVLSVVNFLALLLPAACNGIIPETNVPATDNTAITSPEVSAAVPTPIEAAALTETQTIPAVPTQDDDMQTDPSLPIPAIPGLQPLIEKAKADLAQRLSIPVSEIRLIEIKEVFWPDASLGCPQPGLTYAQVQTPGYLILLESDGNQFEYHANIHNRVFYCENPTPPRLETPGTVHP